MKRPTRKQSLLAAALALTLALAVWLFYRLQPSSDGLDPLAELALGIPDENSPLGEEILDDLDVPWTGDLDGMIERRRIRVLVVHNKLFYFLDGGTQRGITYESFAGFEKFVNRRSKTKRLKVHVLFIPVTRKELLPALVEGRGDIAAANLTITPDRQQLVDFSNPILTDVKEVLVTHRDVETPPDIEALSGEEIHVRPSSSYYQSLLQLNRKLESAGEDPVRINEVHTSLEDGDLLEMVNAGLISRVIVDNHKAQMWKQVFSDIVVHSELVFRRDARIGWALRKNSPQLKTMLNAFVKGNRQGTLHGNVIFNRYLKDNEWIKNPLAKEERKRLESMVELFQQYGQQYDFDWLMIAALAYQESGLDQSKRSDAGAIGVMQLLQSTAEDPRVGIADIDELENNIHAGTKYLRVLQDDFEEEAAIDPLNRTLFTFAAYNAGPTRIKALRRQAKKTGFDANRWFNHVEVVAARRIGRETVQYVSNIYKYYLAYQLVAENLLQRHEAEKSLQ